MFLVLQITGLFDDIMMTNKNDKIIGNTVTKHSLELFQPLSVF